jgi:hypothetical protein
VDLVLSSGNRKVLVEVKIAGSETETKIYRRGWVPQVKKYLSYKVGPVAYLTTKAASAPDVNSKQFLGHFFFEDLYENLTNAKLTLPGMLFREFMEENGMKPLEPFTQRELGNAKQAFDFARKCEFILDEIKSTVEPEFRKLFHTRTRFTGGHFSPCYGSAYVWTKNFTRGNLKTVGVYIEPEEGALYYGVWVRVLRNDTRKLNRVLAWEEKAGFLSSSHPIRPNTNTGNYIKRILKDLKHLQKTLQRVY